MKVQVLNLDGTAAGEAELSDAVFGVAPRADILHRVVTWQLEKRRGTARGARERPAQGLHGHDARSGLSR